MPIDKKFYNLKRYTRIAYVVTVVVSILISYTVGWWAGLIAMVLLALLSNMIFPAQTILKRELMARKKNFDTLKAKFKAIIKQHERWPELDKYNSSVKRLGVLVSSFRSLPGELASQRKRIEEKYFNAKYRYYLFQFDIEKHDIPAFGASKKKLLYDNGIRNAADLNKLTAQKIPGIGPKNIQLLLDWERQVGAGFVYEPDTDAINREINTAAGQIAQKKQKLEADIRAEYKNLQTLKAGIQTVQRNVERQHADAARKVFQAELDLLEFEGLVKKK
jgi:DNA-binding helix-hairpin-helix protein with protein kinase domain